MATTYQLMSEPQPNPLTVSELMRNPRVTYRVCSDGDGEYAEQSFESEAEAIEGAKMLTEVGVTNITVERCTLRVVEECDSIDWSGGQALDKRDGSQN